MPKHDMLKDFDAALDFESKAMKRLSLNRGEPGHAGVLKALIRLLDRIEALEAKLK